MKAIERLYEYIEYKKYKPTRFEKNLGLSNGYLNTQLKRNADLGEGVFNKIIDYCLDLSPEWLLTGKGSMLKSESYKGSEIATTIVPESIPIYNSKDMVSSGKKIPLYDIHASAGLKMLMVNNDQNIIDSITIPNLTKADGAIFITGDSMYPLLKSGDIIVFKFISNVENIIPGDIYILSYQVDGDDYCVIKYVKKSERKGYYLLVSYNEHHQPIDIPISSINALALVKASIRYNTMH